MASFLVLQWMSSGCLVLLQMAHFIFSLHTLAIWFGRKLQNWDLFYSITHWSLSLTVILFKALHSVSLWQVC